jgi:hypothetical protein
MKVPCPRAASVVAARARAAVEVGLITEVES